MKLYYYKDRIGNFGDDLNPWLWSQLIPDQLDEDDSILFIGIGTILNGLEIPGDPGKVVFGSGWAPPRPLPVIDKKWRIYAVRGPLTAQALGIDPGLAVTDPAALLRTIELAPVKAEFAASFIPHHISALNFNWKSICDRVGVNYIPPSSSVDAVLDQVRQSEFVIAEAMHGAIVADALRVPWVPVRCYDHISEFKWKDWCLSVGLDYSPLAITPIWDAEWNATYLRKMKNRVKRALQRASALPGRFGPPPPPRSNDRLIDSVARTFSEIASSPDLQLSSDIRIESRTQELEERLEQFTTDCREGVLF